jgi:Response regulators consisting of a CheY-like receiver domain and a winged-helix DNA-binding domain
MSEQRILIVEDEQMIAELERDYLEANGFTADIASDGTEGMKKVMSEVYDMVILDVMLPGIDGFEICRAIRMSSDVPVMMVTARKEDVDKIRGLGLGADDYMIKPFSPPEMVARVKAHIAMHERLRTDSADTVIKNEIKIGNLRIIPQERRVFAGECEINLAKLEFDLLLFLAENPGIVFSKETLFEKVWGLEAMSDNATVTVHINRLREKLKEADPSNDCIETLWGAGYRMR